MYSDRDVIVAPATCVNQRGPLAIIRVSGMDCVNIIDSCFDGINKITPWKMVYGNWRDELGVVDDVMLSVYLAPKSYTGQDMFEVFCHGNPVLIDCIVKSIVKLGARRARPGEFTIRAVLNGKMDLLRAESVNGLIEANTRYQADLVRRQSRGPIVVYVQEQVEEILQIQAHIEASIDYGEEDIDALGRGQLLMRMEVLIDRFSSLRETGRFSNCMRRGFRVLITGKPNVGKSTLFNRLVKEERAIVTHLPGTTRDLISEQIEINGLPIVLMDSAGVRQTDDVIESMGIEKIYAMLEDVDLVLYLSDSEFDEPPYEKILALPPDRWLHVRTKFDLVDMKNTNDLCVSGLTGDGLTRLEEEVVLRLSSAMDGQSVYLINQRQEDLIVEVIDALTKAKQDYEEGFGEEILSSFLNAARRHLGELTGDTSVEDILDRMFCNFCLGK